MTRASSRTEELTVNMGVQEERFPLCWALKDTYLCEQPGGHAESKISIRDSFLKLQIL